MTNKGSYGNWRVCFEIMKKLLLLSLIFYASYVEAYDFEVDGICYTVSSFEDNTVAVDGLNDSMSGIIDIPSTITFSGKVFTVSGIKSLQNSKIESVIIPYSIVEIGDFAFRKSSITKLVIPDNVKTIGSGAFSGCVELTNIEISKNVSVLNQSLFSGCYKLQHVKWNSNTKDGTIRGGAFYDCTSLKSFYIPSGVSPIGQSFDGANWQNTSIFKNCTSLDSLIIEDGENTPFTFAFFEFEECKIKYLYLGRPFHYYHHNSGDGFRWLQLAYVEDLVIGDNITELPYWPPIYGRESEINNSNLKTLILGASLQKVPSFASNTRLEYIKIRNIYPPQAEGFSNYNYINTILYVPKGTKSVYESSDIWKNFWNIQEYEVDGGNVDIKKCAPPTISYSNGKLNFACETEDVTCYTSITDADIRSYSGNEIQLGATYIINVYATKSGYENSDVVTATICWIDTEPKTEGISNDIAQVRANAVLIQTRNGQISISGADDGTKIFVYGVNGQQAGSATSRNGHANITTNLQSGNIAIIKIGDRSVKVTIK